MEKAIEELDKNDKEKASGKMTDAINALQQARQKLEERLNQLRHEEIERILADLQRRCEKMLAMQIEVRDGTVGVQKAVEGNSEKKPSRGDEQKSLSLSREEEEIVGLADRAIDMLMNEGTAIVFPTIFLQVRSDMANVSRRLLRTDTGVVTQAIENDIIESLKDMVEALKDARQKNKEQKPSKPSSASQNQPQDKNLISILSELKMIRSMEVRVLNRTVTYAQEYPQQKEQAPHPAEIKDPAERDKAEMIQRELKDLARFQEQITDVTRKIARGENKPNQ